MHYCLLLVTEQFPTDKVIETALAPFNDNEQYKENGVLFPAFTWDYWRLGGRYAGRLKLSVEDNETYRWDIYEKEPRCGRLFRSFLLENLRKLYIYSRRYFEFSEEEYFTSMGFLDGFLYVDGAKISDVTNIGELNCLGFIDRNGQGFSKERWDGNHWINDADYESKLKSALAESKDCYACVIDIHD